MDPVVRREDSRHGGSKIFAVLAAGAMLAISMPSANAQSEYPEGFDPTYPYLDNPYPNSVYRPDNVLIVDGITGAIQTWDNRGSGYATVRVTGVTPGSVGYILKNPLRDAIFTGAKATSAGYVEFLKQQLSVGAWEILRLSGGVEMPVATFVLTSVQLGQAQTNDGGTSAPQDCGWAKQHLNSTNLLWTPVLIAHAPWLGSASAQGGWSTTTTLFVSAGAPGTRLDTEYQSRLSTSDGLVTSNGETMAAFQLVEWGFIEIEWQDTACQFHKKYTAYILDPAPGGATRTQVTNIWGPRKDTDADDKVALMIEDISTMIYETRYRGRQWELSIEAGGGEYYSQAGWGTSTIYTNGGTVWSNWVSVSIGMTASRETSQAYSYEYHFPSAAEGGGNRTWYASYYGWNSSRSFCYPRTAGC